MNDFFQTNEKYVYLDSASTSFKPKIVIEKITEYNKKFNSNASRGSYKLSFNSTSIMDDVRKKIKKVYNANESYEVIFTKGATESINIVANSFLKTLDNDSEILVCINNHNSNILPFKYQGKKIKYIDIDSNGKLDIRDLERKINEKTKLISISHIVNTTGVENDIYEVIKLCKEKNIKILLDISQTVSHMILNFSDIDADFYVFSSHKMFGPQGLGFLVAKKELLNKMPPFMYGGDMVDYVSFEEDEFKNIPQKFEAGTQNISSIYGFYYALEYIEQNIQNIHKKEEELLKYLLKKLEELKYIKIYHRQEKIPIVCFNVSNVHSHDVSSFLDNNNVYIRTGKHCTNLLMDRIKENSTCRVSLSVYNTKEDINSLIKSLEEVNEIFNG